MDQLGRRQVTAEEGARWAADRDMLFLGEHHMIRGNDCNVAYLETSAKKHDGVDTVFTVLVDQILQRPQVNLDFSSVSVLFRLTFLLTQLWECEAQPRDEGGQPGLVLSLGSIRGHLGQGGSGDRGELGCCAK